MHMHRDLSVCVNIVWRMYVDSLLDAFNFNREKNLKKNSVRSLEHITSPIALIDLCSTTKNMRDLCAVHTVISERIIC